MYYIKEAYGMCFCSDRIKKAYRSGLLYSVKKGDFIGFRLGGVFI